MSSEPPAEPSRVTRRTVLKGLSVAVAAALPGTLTWALRKRSDAEVVAIRLASLVSDPVAGRRIGTRYLEDLGSWPASGALAASLLPDHLTVAQAAHADLGQLRAGIAAHDEQDQLAGRIAAYDGWLLSETVGRLGALVVLTGR